MNINSLTPMVYVVDDEFSIRDSLSLLIKSTGHSVSSFESADAFLNDYNPDRPGCLVLDVRMPFMNGHELQDELVNRGIHIPTIFISGHAAIADSAKAFRAGAVDFLEKPLDTDLLLGRINEALEVDIAYREKLIKKHRIQDRINQLTPREKEVLDLIVKSHSNKEAAIILNISNRTIDVHRANIMDKMQVDNIAGLVTMIMCVGNDSVTI